MRDFSWDEVHAIRARALAALPDVPARARRWDGPYAQNAAGCTVLQPIFTRGHLRVLVSVEDKPDGYPWLHVSVSRDDRRLPEYAELAEVRRCFLPMDRPSVEVWAAADEHYSFAEVRHLWCRLEGPPAVPDLRIFERDGAAGV